MVDFPGGGYICMNPQHHEERLRQLAKEMQKPVLAVDYCKAPEYPYPSPWRNVSTSTVPCTRPLERSLACPALPISASSSLVIVQVVTWPLA